MAAAQGGPHSAGALGPGGAAEESWGVGRGRDRSGSGTSSKSPTSCSLKPWTSSFSTVLNRPFPPHRRRPETPGRLGPATSEAKKSRALAMIQGRRVGDRVCGAEVQVALEARVFCPRTFSVNSGLSLRRDMGSGEIMRRRHPGRKTGNPHPVHSHPRTAVLK